jgi:site-specific recombinase XerD
LKLRIVQIAVGVYVRPDAERITVAMLADDICADYAVNARASAQDLEYRLNHLLPLWVTLKPHELGTDLIKRYVVQRQQEKAANASINREMASLKRMFNLGLQAQKIHRKPYIPSLTEDNIRQGFFEYAEFVSFRNAIAED